MNSLYKLEYNRLVSMLVQLQTATTENSINGLSKNISNSYRNLLRQSQSGDTLHGQLLKLRPSIIEVYNKKQNEIKRFHENNASIRKDYTIVSRETEEEINKFFNNKNNSISDKKKTDSTDKVYTYEEILNQIDQIFDSEGFLNADGTINHTTKEILLERIYLLSRASDSNQAQVLELLKYLNQSKNASNQIDNDSTKDDVSLIQPSAQSSGEDEKNLEEQVCALFAPD